MPGRGFAALNIADVVDYRQPTCPVLPGHRTGTGSVYDWDSCTRAEAAK
jgi:hypothetical protein